MVGSSVWLSEDPLEDVDSPNLYAFVGWGGQSAIDPTGECLGLSNKPCRDHAASLRGWFANKAAAVGGVARESVTAISGDSRKGEEIGARAEAIVSYVGGVVASPLDSSHFTSDAIDRDASWWEIGIAAWGDASELYLTFLGAKALAARFSPRFSPPVPPPDPPKLAEDFVRWVDEGGDMRAGRSAGMSSDAYAYQSGATGARSNPYTGRSQAPVLDYSESAGQPAAVKFDAPSGSELVDRKLAVHTGSKTQELARRQSKALEEKGLRGFWEVPTEAEKLRAERLMVKQGITNIEVRVVPR